MLCVCLVGLAKENNLNKSADIIPGIVLDLLTNDNVRTLLITAESPPSFYSLL
jgi:hypothetical protein